MTPLEAMAKAEQERLPGATPWKELPEHARREYVDDMRAALLALAEAELPWEQIQSGDAAYYAVAQTKGGDRATAITNQFRAICRAIAEEGTGK